MSRTPLRPFLITKDEDGTFRITIRETRFNSQHYPLVTTTVHEDRFKTATAARTFARDHLGAAANEFATK